MQWLAWSSCTFTCGGGTSTRARVCNQPLHGGDECTGSSSDVTTCNLHECPGKSGKMAYSDVIVDHVINASVNAIISL